MIRWIPYTFVRTVIFFIGGILLAIYFPDSIPEKIALTFLFALLILYIVLFITSTFRKKLIVNPGLIALPAVFIAGYLHLLTQTESRDFTHLMHVKDEIRYYKVIVNNYAEEKEKSWKLTAEVTEIKTDRWKQAEGKAVLYFSKNDFNTPFNYGEVLLIRGKPRMVDPPGNPGEFNYKVFLAYRNIFHQHFLRKNDVVSIALDPPNFFMFYALKARLWANQILHRYVDGKNEQAVASALILGVTDGLDNELLTAYAATGAMHVLAVSGLHITIIYLIILVLLKPLTKTKSGNWIVAIVSLALLWAYAFITGLSPSVLRAVTMFTFIAVAKATSRNTNIYNTLAASGFCLLLFDPYLIMSVGFQLSYLAVIGIVYIHPLLYRLWEADSWLMDEVWKIISVSIAAQLATFALGLLYFHQFPNYFLLSNLLVIPLSFMVLVVGLSLLAASVIPFVAGLIGILLEVVIKLLNLMVVAVDWLPFSLIENIHITTLQCWILMGVIIFFILMIQKKKFQYFLIGSSLMIIFALTQWIHFVTSASEERIMVYKISGHSAMDLTSHGRVYFYADSSLLADEKMIRFHIQPNRLAGCVTNVVSDIPFSFGREIPGGKIILWRNKKILYITGKAFNLSKIIDPDLIVIANNAVSDLSSIHDAYPVAEIVFDSSNKYYYVDKMLKAGQSIPGIFSVLHEGAFELKIEKKA